MFEVRILGQFSVKCEDITNYPSNAIVMWKSSSEKGTVLVGNVCPKDVDCVVDLDKNETIYKRADVDEGRSTRDVAEHIVSATDTARKQKQKHVMLKK